MSNINLNDIFENSEIEFVRYFGTAFYKCPFGHLYYLGECGRSMEVSKGPNYGFIIRGGDHRSKS